MATKTTAKAVKKQETTKAPATPAIPVTPKAAPVKVTAAKTAPVKTSAAPKKPAVKKEIKIKTIVEYLGKQVEEKDVIASVKKAWTKSGKKIGDIKSIELYIKPEEQAIYYVINETETGSVAF